MNSRRQRTGIDLRLYRVDPQFWQCQLLAPTHFTASGFAHYQRLRQTLLILIILLHTSLVRTFDLRRVHTLLAAFLRIIS